MRLLAVDQDGICARDRGLWRALRDRSGIEIILVVPERWRVDGQFVRAEPEHTPLCVIPGAAVLAGRSHRAFYPALQRLVRKMNPDILYVNAEPESFLGFQGALIKHCTGASLKYVMMSWRNIDYPQGGFPYKFARVHDWAEKYSLGKADACIARSSDASKILGKKGFGKSVVIPPAVDLSVFYPVDGGRGSADVRNTRWVAGFVGRIDEQKGIDTLLEAVSSLDPGVSVLIAGEGPAKEKLQRLARTLGMAERVRWEPAVPHSQVRELFTSLDALVLPSHTGILWKEQFGRVLIESMACGVPVIGSDSGEIPNVIADAGLVVPEGDPRALAGSLVRLRDNEQLRRDLIARGLSRVERHFCIDAVVPLYQELFTGIAGEASAGTTACARERGGGGDRAALSQSRDV
jgi:glycosyltransferase involved in cell wall biosynthesis